MKKYEEGLTEEQLDEQIKKVGSLIPKEDPNSKYQLVIVEGYIFEIDRSVPKIIDYKGPADGIIITASISQNGNWQNPVATVTGTITKYGGGTVISSSATATNGVTILGFPTVGGSYTIPNITTDTDITITAQDSEGNDPVTETIKVKLKRDNTPPVLSNATVTAERMKLKIKVTASDDVSGVAQINYKITPKTVDTTTPAEGTLESGKEKEIITTAEGEYTVTFTATDNAGNTTDPGVTVKETTIDGITIAEAKELVNETTLKQYIGMKVRDYNPKAGGTWRVFYYDKTGYFGVPNVVYLRRDYDKDTAMQIFKDKTSSAGMNMLKRMNPMWRDSENGQNFELDTQNAIASYLCDPYEWRTYRAPESSFAIGAPSFEMLVMSFNICFRNNSIESEITCSINGSGGYSKEGEINLKEGDLGFGDSYWVCSPGTYGSWYYSLNVGISGYFGLTPPGNGWNSARPVVPLDQ